MHSRRWFGSQTRSPSLKNEIRQIMADFNLMTVPDWETFPKNWEVRFVLSENIDLSNGNSARNNILGEEVSQRVQIRKQDRLANDIETFNLAAAGFSIKEAAEYKNTKFHLYRNKFERVRRVCKFNTGFNDFVVSALMYPRASGAESPSQHFPRYSVPSLDVDRVLALDRWEEAAILVRDACLENEKSDPLEDLREYLGLGVCVTPQN